MIKENSHLMVSIHCLAYNQEAYIRECLEGFVSQITDFRFEAIVHDDASTDGTAVIIREYERKYPDIIKPLYETENQYSKHDGSLNRIMEEHTHGKYIAVCEGDDYWIDPLKLQKQVDILENNSDVGLVYTNHLNRKGDIILRHEERGYTQFDQLVISSGIGTLTSCYRTELYKQYLIDIHPYDKGWLMGDAPLWKYISFHSKIKFLPDYTAVYRILESSASHHQSIERRISFINSGYDVQTYFINKYVDEIVKRKRFLATARKNRDMAVVNAYMQFGKFSEVKKYIRDNKDSFGLREIAKIQLHLIHNSLSKNL